MHDTTLTAAPSRFGAHCGTLRKLPETSGRWAQFNGTGHRVAHIARAATLPVMPWSLTDRAGTITHAQTRRDMLLDSRRRLAEIRFVTASPLNKAYASFLIARLSSWYVANGMRFANLTGE